MPAPRLVRGSTIVFDGDSITNRRTPPTLDTWPYLQLMNWQGTWADEVARLLFCWRPELRLGFHNAAVGGSIAADLVERFDRFVAPHRPKLVIATIGSNDSARQIPLKDFAAHVESYTAAVARLGGKVAWIGGLPGPDGPYPRKVPYVKILRDSARRHGGWCLEPGAEMVKAQAALRAQWDGHTLFSDGNHLNAAGSAFVAGVVLRWLGVLR
jgi:lysophospholipase L1-like esterase